jgi:hypothetical protein
MTNKIKFAMLPAAVVITSSVASAEIRLTQNDVDQMKHKVDLAAKFFQSTWRDVFSQAGKSYPHRAWWLSRAKCRAPAAC